MYVLKLFLCKKKNYFIISVEMYKLGIKIFITLHFADFRVTVYRNIMNE